MRRLIALFVSHALALALGFALGIYALPILTAPEGYDTATLEAGAQDAVFSGEFDRNRRGSDFLHWGEGSVSLTPTQVIHMGKLAPGPDYKLYLVNDFVEHEDEFLPIKDQAQLVGDVKTFDGFLLELPQGVDPAAYSTLVVWCEAFEEFITSARYQ